MSATTEGYKFGYEAFENGLAKQSILDIALVEYIGTLSDKEALVAISDWYNGYEASERESEY